MRADATTSERTDVALEPQPVERVGQVTRSERLHAAPAPSERLANVERLRLVAMFEIVAFHVSAALDENARLPIIAGLGLPTFLLLNNAFNCTLAERMGAGRFLRLKVSRLFLPWAVWSAIYALSLLGEAYRHGEPLFASFTPWMILGGTYDHLWFVPFALFGGVVVAWLEARTRRLEAAAVVWGALGAGLASVIIGALIMSRLGLDWPVAQWIFALPSPLFGLGLGRALLAQNRSLLRGLAVSAGVLAAIALGLAWIAPEAEMVRRYAMSLAAVTIAFIWTGKPDRISRRLTPLLFGVYLVHPLIVRLYQAFHARPLPLAGLASAVFALAAVSVAVMRRTPLRSLV